MPETFIYIFIAAFSASVGSFLNVCIHRIPVKQSLFFPPSKCPGCGAPIRFYDNIPIISYMALRGRCRNCGVSISAVYPLVEILTSLFGVLLYMKFGFNAEFFAYAVFISSLVVITFIDLRLKIIPDVITLPGIVAGFFLSAVLGIVDIYSSGIGIILGAGVLITITAIYYLLTKTSGMGGGDVKLLAMIGAFLGWRGVIFTLFAGSFLGAIVGIILMAFSGKNSKYAVPFGPFLAFGAAAYVFFGKEVAAWYISTIFSV